jgi:hypothetical protein
MEVLMKILNQGTEFDTLAETATRDRYEQLANLMATMGEKGELPLAVALANVVPSNEQDDLAQVLVTLFDAMDLLYQFLWNILSQEVKLNYGDCCFSTEAFQLEKSFLRNEAFSLLIGQVRLGTSQLESFFPPDAI